MYKKLSREEESILRESIDPTAEPPRKGVILRNLIWFMLGFLVFVVIACLIFSSGAAALGQGGQPAKHHNTKDPLSYYRVTSSARSGGAPTHTAK